MPISPLIANRLKLLRDLPANELLRFCSGMRLVEVARRKVVVGTDSPPDGMGFLVSGRLQGVDFTLDGREVGLYFVEPNDYFAELALIDNEPLPELIIATTASTVGFMDRAAALDLLDSFPAAARQLNVQLSRRVRDLLSQRKILAMPSAQQRICATLFGLCSRNGPEPHQIRHAPTHQEIAIMVNTTRETVTRTMQSLQSTGCVQRDGPHLLVHDPDALRRMARGEDGIR
jgi:CRP/FNR family transcriptional regulator, cyclic AMP receptor protein